MQAPIVIAKSCGALFVFILRLLIHRRIVGGLFLGSWATSSAG